MGTIKISTKLSNLLYNQENNYIITHLKYTAKYDSVNSMVTHPILILLQYMGHYSLKLKVRARK